jgi:hypothetical protein
MDNGIFLGFVIGAVFNQYTLGVWRFEQAFALKPTERRREYAGWIMANTFAACFAVMVVEAVQWAAPVIAWPFGISSEALGRVVHSCAHVALGIISIAFLYGFGYMAMDLWETRKRTR